MRSILDSRLLRTLTAVLILPLLITAVIAQSSPTETAVPVEPVFSSPQSVTYDDGGPWEVGIEQAGDNLEAHANAESFGLAWRLSNCGWIVRYRYNDYWSWEQDFKRTTAGGTEPWYLDTVDLAFFVGHGGPGYFKFVSNVDDHYLTTSDCYRSWGNGDNDWVALTSCQVLADSHLVPWARCLYGTHLILGFKSNARASDIWWRTNGYYFAHYLCNNYTVAQAWYKAADRSQPAGRVVRAIINELAYLGDRPFSGFVGGPDSYDWDAWVQTHVAGSEMPRYVDVAALDGTMPVFQAPPLSLEEAQGLYTQLGETFDIPVDANKYSNQGDTVVWSDTVDGRELEMDSSGGLYGYTDLNNLWTYTQTTKALTNKAILAPEDARDIADQFLRSNDLMPSDAQFYEVAEDTISSGDVVSGTYDLHEDSLLDDERVTVYQVIYSRIIPYTPPTLNGQPNAANETINFSVIGPGAKQKVYVDPSPDPTPAPSDRGWTLLMNPPFWASSAAGEKRPNNEVCSGLRP